MAILQQMAKNIPQDQRSDELQASMAHTEHIIASQVPYRGEIGMDLMGELFQADTGIAKHLSNQGLQDRLGLEFRYEMCPDPDIDKSRGKKDRETKQDVKDRYGKLIRDYIGSVVEK